MSKSIYVIMYGGVTYNDEIYYSSGDDANVSSNAYEDKQEALEAYVQYYRDIMQGFHVGDFSYDEWDEKAWQWCVDHNIPIEKGNCERLSYPECIAKMEELGEDWVNLMPPLLDIREVTLVPGVVDPQTLENAKSKTVEIAKNLQVQ